MRSRRVIWLAALAMVLIAGAFGVWWVLLRDTAAPEADLDAVGTPAAGATDGGPASPDGTWKVRTGDDVFVGYRVQELFAGDSIKKVATGRTPEVSGELTIAGSQVTVTHLAADLTALTSRQERRDSSLRTRGIETGRFPEATFDLAEPIRLAAVKRGEAIDATAKGRLTLHGRTRPVQIELRARWNGASITVAATTPIAFADYGIDVIEIPGFVKTDDRGTLELQLLFQPA